VSATSFGPFGAIPDENDDRDRRYDPPNAALPVNVDLRAYCGPCYDQLPLQSCTAHATASALTWLANRAGTPIVPPSRLFLYFNARRLAGTQGADTGASMRNAIKSVVRAGSCAETDWPYDPAQVLIQPPKRCYDAATVHAIAYQRIDRRLDALRACLAEGFPFAFAMDAYAQPFTEANTNGGKLRLPQSGDTLCGGHAVLAVGYNEDAHTITALNSLGPTFGANGYFTMPYAYFTEPKLTYDHWTIRRIERSTRG
jgi:C1A family cysteine protease